MTSLLELSRDNGAFTTGRAQAHLTLLRMFCGIYDLFGTMHPLVTMVMKRAYTAQEVEHWTNYYLEVANFRYTLYLDLLVSLRHTPKNTWPLPQWDVALMMHTHMLSPVKFANDIASNPRYSSLAGIIDLPLMRLYDKLQNIDNPDFKADRDLWFAKYPNKPERNYELLQILATRGQKTIPPNMVMNNGFVPKRYKFTKPPPFGIDLVEGVKRQIAFARKITAIYPYDPVPETMLLDSEQRYAKFMNLIRLNATEIPVPALDIDLFWHTHQLMPSNYLPWCNHHIGRPINHDDTVGAGDLDTGLAMTISAWQATYSEDYLNLSPNTSSQTAPQPMPQATPNTNRPTQVGVSTPVQQPLAHRPMPPAQAGPSRPPIIQPSLTTADKNPTPGLTPAQLNLWEFDVKHQEIHEQLDYRLRESRSRLASYNNQVAALGPPPTSLMKRLTDSSNRKTLEANRGAVARSIKEQIRLQDEFRAAWGRNRWTLLVQARGWGYTKPTMGHVRREPQGSTSLDFPIYAATWYDKKELGYYDYVSGGRGGGGTIEGGGLPLGGGMCGGRFDGGNCSAVVPMSSYSNPGCSGGGG